MISASRKTDISVCLLLAVSLIAGCSSRTRKQTRTTPGNPQVLLPPEPAPAEPKPPPSPRALPEAPSDVCIPVFGGDCVPAPEFNRRASEQAPGHAAHQGFENQWGLESVNAHLAYAHVGLLEGPDVAPGEGITIGVIDTGIDADHPAFAGKTVHEEFLFGATEETGEEGSHGTAVASVAAGGRTDHTDAPHGVAWGADLAVWAIPLGSPDGIYNPITPEELAEQDSGFAGLFESVLSWRTPERPLDILNLSFGYDGLIDEYSEEVLRANFSETIAALAQTDSPDKAILVWAAGNANGEDCIAGTPNCEDGRINAVSVGILPGLLARIEELQGHSVAVVALSPDGGGIAGFSNRCGIAADHCIAAPGEKIQYAFFGPNEGEVGVQGYGEGGGTSFAAPFVAGGLAVMKQLFREQLSNEELVSRLFATADDTGIYADRAIYGNGRMDLGAATSPVGVLSVPIGTSGLLTAGSASLDATRLRMGAAFGDGVQQALEGSELMALDGLGAPFWRGMDSFAVTTDGPGMGARLRSFLGSGSAFTGDAPEGASGIAADVLRMPTASGSGHLALAEGAVMFSAFSGSGLSATAFTTGNWRAGMPASGAAMAYRPNWLPESLPVGLRAGFVEERETLLGSMGHGAFGNLSATTAFVGLDGGIRLGRFFLGGSGELGLAHPDVHGGILRDISMLATSAFSVRLGTSFEDRSSLELSVSQPLRVESGHASLTVPSARIPGGGVTHHPLRADLAPGARQLDLSARWSRPLSLGELRFGTVWSHRAGHRHSLGREVALLSGWRWTF